MVKVTFAPTDGLGLSTTFVTARSASGTSTLALPESLALAGSNVVALTVAVFVSGEDAVTRATIVRVSPAPFASAPMVHTPAL